MSTARTEWPTDCSSSASSLYPSLPSGMLMLAMSADVCTACQWLYIQTSTARCHCGRSLAPARAVFIERLAASADRASRRVKYLVSRTRMCCWLYRYTWHQNDVTHTHVARH